MNTPIVDFVRKYSENGVSRLHMPGHKGVSFLGCEYLDITEIKGADALFEAEGIINNSERNVAELFGSARTLYSAEGSTLCIKTMLALVRKNGKKNRILASRNSHKSLVYGCAQLDIDIDWLWDENDSFSLCRCKICAENLDNLLRKYDELPCAVYITSPDYLGGELDIKALAEIAHRYALPLLVDNAHGAYLHFLQDKRHPIDLGADMCCDSAHKTLPVLTGGAYLHISKNADAAFSLKSKKAMEMFASTSPSYLILQSLDNCNAYLADGYDIKLENCIEKIEELKNYLSNRGWVVMNSDPLKLTVASGGIDLAESLRKFGVECEYEAPDYTVMMFTPENSDEDFIRVKNAMSECAEITVSESKMMIPEKIMSVRDAVLGDYEVVSVEKAVGRICASPAVGCPPAVPIVVAGEKISTEAVKIFKYYGISNCLVLK